VNSHAQIKIQYKCKGGQCQIRYDNKIGGGGGSGKLGEDGKMVGEVSVKMMIRL